MDNTGLTTFGLRAAEIDFTTPTALASGFIAQAIAHAAELDAPACNLAGSGTFSLLLQFDTVAGTLTLGGAKPVADPTQGYSFDTDTLQGFSLAPVVLTTTPGVGGSFGSATGQNLVLPVFLDSAGDMVVLVPLHQATITMGQLTAGQNCVGSYNAATLLPANSCQPSASMTAFTDDASLTGFITLQDANNVDITTLNESLCAFFSGGADTTTNGSGEGVCATDSNGNVVFQGNWCSTTNAAATANCADSIQLAANLAASSVAIH